MPNPVNYTGKRFGTLTVLNKADPIRIGVRLNPTWLCECDCGVKKVVAAIYLRRGSTTSCGCLRNVPDRLRQISIEERFYNYWKVNRDVKIKGMELSYKEFISLVTQNCYYCGQEPKMVYTIKNSRIVLYYNGIDRVNNDHGYYIENCVPACNACNRMKLQMSQQEFFEHIKRICSLHSLL